MRWLVRVSLLTAAVLPAATVRAQRQTPGAWDDRAVEQAIRRGREYLWSQWRGGHWPEQGRRGVKEGAGHTPNYGGITALCTYALLAAGESPKDARMKQTLQWLAGCPMHGVYARSVRANVWAMLGRNSEHRRNLSQDVDWLVKALDGRGAYNYVPAAKAAARYDNSNSQMGVLGVWAGARNDVEVPTWYWRRVEKHWKADQNDDGGWGYQSGRASTGSMSVAGLATLFICFDNLHFRDFASCAAEAKSPPIEKGLKWLHEHFTAEANPGRRISYYYYYLYGVERVGLASGQKYFGNKDWYKLGAAALLRRQGGRGDWGDGLIDTSFALLFLARGRHPILFNKLQYEGAWNSRPRDLANLTRWVSRTFERQVNWQIIHLGVPVSEWHDAPILYVSGSKAPSFSQRDLAKLRQFVHQGGVIFSEAACSRTAFSLAMRNYYATMFPQYELARLDESHPLFSKELQFQIDKTRSLAGISNGVRLLAIHAPAEVSRAWQLNNYKTEGEVFRQAANIYFYVTDKGILPPRGVNRWPMKKDVSPVDSLRVARVKYDGNHDPEPLAWQRFAILMANRHRLAVEVSQPMQADRLEAARWPVAAMTGTAAFELTDDQRAALRRYVVGGGTLVVDAAGGSDAFVQAAEKQIQDLLPGGRWALVPAEHDLYTKAGPPVGKVRYRRATAKPLIDSRKPRLRAIRHNGRLAIIFSRDDLTAGLVGYPCWSVKGYEPESAFALMRNILLYASGKTLAPAVPPGQLSP